MTKPHTTLSEAVRALTLPSTWAEFTFDPESGALVECGPLLRNPAGTGTKVCTLDQARDLLESATKLVEQDESNADEWRRLALQFDEHRVQALGHLRALLANAQKHAPIAQEFVSAPPLDSESVLAQRIADMVEQHEAQEPVAASEPVIAEFDMEKVKKLKDSFVQSMINSGVQYGTCGVISAALNQIINSNSVPQPTLAATRAGDAKVISIGNGATLQREAKTTGAVGWLMYNEHGLVRSLDAFETQLVESALAAMPPTTTRSE